MPQQQTDAQDPQIQAGARMAVVVLVTVYVLAFIDRQLLNLLIEPMKRSLTLSDIELSLIQGAAFTASYVLFGPLFGWLADRMARRLILMGCVVAWSVATLACGFSWGFWTLFISRFVVGAAEACVHPAAWSMLADFFPRKSLPRAMSVFLIAPYFGGGLALIFGGVLITFAAILTDVLPVPRGVEEWRLVFMVVGAIGIPVACLLLLLREPKRREADGDLDTQQAPTPGEVLRFLWDRRAFYGRFICAMTGIAIVLYALPAWMPALLLRNYSGSIGLVGMHYGTVVLIAGTAGVLLGPSFSRFLEKRGVPSNMLTVVALSSAALFLAALALPWMPTYTSALAVAGVMSFFFGLPQAMAATTMQLTTPARMRGMATSIYILILNVVGLGAAPSLVAVLTDSVFKDPHRVGWSLSVVCAVSALIAAWMAWQARPQLQRLAMRTA